jgi:cytochrome c
MYKYLFMFPVVLLCLAAKPVAEKPAVAPTTFAPMPPEIPAEIASLLSKYNCTSCHAMARKLIGPMWMDIAAKKYTPKRIVGLIYKPEPKNWPGYPPMVAQPTVPKADANKIATWLAGVKE